MSFADSLRQNSKEKEQENSMFDKAVQQCHSKLRSYCETHSADGRAEGYLLGEVMSRGYSSMMCPPEVYPSQHETGSRCIRMRFDSWMEDLYKGKVDTWELFNRPGRESIVSRACKEQHRFSSVVGMTVPAGDPKKDFDLRYKFAPGYIIAPLCSEPLAFCQRLAGEIEKLLVEDGFFHVSVSTENCCDSYDIIRQNGSMTRCWFEHVSTPKVVGYAIRFHVEW